MDDQKPVKALRVNPPRTLALSFGLLILLGSILLNMPFASKDGKSLGPINALFMASSSVCVTGLTVVNTAEHWTSLGQLIIIVLVQIGAIGTMTFTTIAALLLGKRIGLRDRLLIKEGLNQDSMKGLDRLVKYILVSTFIIELIGSFFLSLRFIPIYGWKTGLWYSIFHSISGFCNAGFDLLGDSLTPFVGDIILNLTIAGLIILGGLGFSVYIDVGQKRSFKKFNLHTKLVLIMTLALVLGGSIIFFALEYTNPETFGKLTFGEKVLASYFQSVMTRTAGYYSVDPSKLREGTVFFMIVLMFIGGSPGSTAGGIKTTTFGVLVLSTLSLIRGYRDISIFSRRISNEIVRKSLALIMVAIFLIISISLVLTITEEAGFLDLLYETTSAFTTAGVSRNLTPKLSNIGRLLISLTMYCGRVGPLTMAFALGSSDIDRKYRYPEEDILVG